LVTAVALLLLSWLATCAQDGPEADQETAEADQKTTQAEQIPPIVMNTLKARFPRAEIREWSRETEGDVVLYDIEFEQAGQKFEADIKEDGTIHNWEEEVAATALPAAVRNAVEAAYPRSTLKEIMAITAVVDGAEALEGYEVVLETVDAMEAEVTVAPSGIILEDSGAAR
jgi:hypothetical protein